MTEEEIIATCSSNNVNDEDIDDKKDGELEEVMTHMAILDKILFYVEHQSNTTLVKLLMMCPEMNECPSYSQTMYETGT